MAAPNYSTIWKRVGNTMPKFHTDRNFRIPSDSIFRWVVDSTGIRNANRGEWIRVHWNVKRGFFKLHILVDLDTRRILAFCLTDMNGGDAAQLSTLLNKALRDHVGRDVRLPTSISELVVDDESAVSKRAGASQALLDRWMPGYEDTVKNGPAVPRKPGAKDMVRAILAEHEALQYIAERVQNMGIHIEMRGDGGYDVEYAFALLNLLNIIPIIRMRSNSKTNARKKDRSRDMCALEQFGGKGDCTDHELNRMTKSERLANQKEWKKHKRFGLRWFVEIVISSFKRTFGESVRVRSPRTTFIEIATKITAYNHNLDIGDEAIQNMRDIASGYTHNGASGNNEVTCLYGVAA